MDIKAVEVVYVLVGLLLHGQRDYVWVYIPDWILDRGFQGRPCFFVAARLRVGVPDWIWIVVFRGCVRTGSASSRFWVCFFMTARLRVGGSRRPSKGTPSFYPSTGVLPGR